MKKIVIPIFIVVMLAQLYVPAQMILGRESVISEGEVFKFITAPVDPSDPFRGKYIILNFEATEFSLTDENDFEIYQDVYVWLEKDENGYAQIANVTKEAPTDDVQYVKAIVQQLTPYENPEKLRVRYLFDRFYMEESKAYDAEVSYRESMENEGSHTYALVHIKDGQAVVTDVFIDELPILQYLKENASQEQENDNN